MREFYRRLDILRKSNNKLYIKVVDVLDDRRLSSIKALFSKNRSLDPNKVLEEVICEVSN